MVATATEGAQEIIQTGETGLLVPVGDEKKLADAVLVLLNEKDKRVLIGTAAQQAVSVQFNVERMVTETEGIYRTEIGKHA